MEEGEKDEEEEEDEKDEDKEAMDEEEDEEARAEGTASRRSHCTKVRMRVTYGQEGEVIRGSRRG